MSQINRTSELKKHNCALNSISAASFTVSCSTYFYSKVRRFVSLCHIHTITHIQTGTHLYTTRTVRKLLRARKVGKRRWKRGSGASTRPKGQAQTDRGRKIQVWRESCAEWGRRTNWRGNERTVFQPEEVMVNVQEYRFAIRFGGQCGWDDSWSPFRGAPFYHALPTLNLN